MRYKRNNLSLINILIVIEMQAWKFALDHWDRVSPTQLVWQLLRSILVPHTTQPTSPILSTAKPTLSVEMGAFKRVFLERLAVLLDTWDLEI